MTLIDRTRHHVRRPLARTPYLWDGLMLTRPSKRRTLARRDTGIVIEGFLRSGNTFSVAAFEQSNGPDIHIGRHLHSPAHVLRAARLGIPTVVLIRQPRPSVLSYLIRRPTLTPHDGVLEYLDFYRTAWPARSSFVAAPFDHVVTDFGSVLRAVNARFGTSFACYESTPDNDEAVFAAVEEMNRQECGGAVVETHVARPSAARSGRSEELRSLLEEPRAARALGEAETLYQRYVALWEARG